jgi:hypothetical protein
MHTAPPLPFRQIHLDFHTSEHIPGVGADFDGKAHLSRSSEDVVTGWPWQGQNRPATLPKLCPKRFFYLPRASNPHFLV